MEVILKQDVQNLGFKDEIVSVKPGYARNYLIPNGMAILASDSAKKVLAENNKQRAHKLEKIKKEAEAYAKKIEGTKLSFKVHTSSQGNIYGSISPSHIAEALEKKGFEVDRKRIKINAAVKQVGNYIASLILHREVVVEVPFTVESENPSAEKDNLLDKGEAEATAPENIRSIPERETNAEEATPPVTEEVAE